MHSPLDIACELIRRESITPNDASCQVWIAEYLRPLGFQITELNSHNVKNMWAIYGEPKGPLLTFVGHTDVVPPGPLCNWRTPPFEPTLVDGTLYGRGSADMKSSIAAMLYACNQLITAKPKLNGRIAFAITSDEEGDAKYGSRVIADHLKTEGIYSDYYLIGEPSSSQRLADTIKVGRRGSLHGHLTLIGRQGHIAYPHLANNPIEKLGNVLNALFQEQWDLGHTAFPATQFQISQLQAGTGAKNVIPGQLQLDFNFRYSPASSIDSLKQRTHQILDQANIDYTLDWHLSAEPFFSPAGKLQTATEQAIKDICHIKTTPSTAGGTSDGRFFAPLGGELIELGPINASIHQANESVLTNDIKTLSEIYQHILKTVLL